MTLSGVVLAVDDDAEAADYDDGRFDGTGVGNVAADLAAGTDDNLKYDNRNSVHSFCH